MHDLMYVLSGLAILLLVYAACHDILARTVPNCLPLCVLGLGVAFRLLDHSLLIGFAIASVTFAILFGIWVLNIMGGGDVKLWAATVLLVKPVFLIQMSFFCHVFLIGGLLGVFYLILFFVLSKPAIQKPSQKSLWSRWLLVESRRISRRGPLPYAVAISASAIISIAMQ
jgi:prepilin peptidase CpaA